MKLETIENKEKWDKFITSKREANFLQSWDFYEFHKKRGKRIVRRAVLDDKGEIIAAYAGVVETAKRGKHLAIAGGPILDWGNRKLVNLVFEDIKRRARKRNVFSFGYGRSFRYQKNL